MNKSKSAKLSKSNKGRWKGTKQIPCSFCGKKLWITPYYLKKKNYKNYYCDKKCEAQGRSFGNNKELKGGWYGTGGYHYVRVNGKHTLVHRIVMERKLKRKLKKTEQVHHLNGIGSDNRIENLCIVDYRNHPTESSKLIDFLRNRIRELEKRK